MGQSALTPAEVEDLAAGEDVAGPREVRRDGYPQTKATPPKLMSVEGISPSSSSRSRGLEIQESEADALLLYEQQMQNGGDDRWLSKLPRDVSAAQVCESIAQSYKQRRKFTEANIWMKKAQAYAPSGTTFGEAPLQKGLPGNPQDSRLWQGIAPED
eukprot:g7136.t1